MRFRGAGIEVAEMSGGSALASVAFSTSDQPAEWAIINVGQSLELRLSPGPGNVPVPMLCR
jgi:hypothetical protein